MLQSLALLGYLRECLRGDSADSAVLPTLSRRDEAAAGADRSSPAGRRAGPQASARREQRVTDGLDELDEPIVQRAEDAVFTSRFIVPKDSPAQTLADLNRRLDRAIDGTP